MGRPLRQRSSRRSRPYPELPAEDDTPRFPFDKYAALPHIAFVRVFFTKTYERAVRKLMSDANRQVMEAAIVADPGAAPVIRGTGGIRKLRWAGSGRGKRGGIRTIYFHHAEPEVVYLLTAYAKTDQDDLSAADKKVLRRLVAAIKNEEKNR